MKKRLLAMLISLAIVFSCSVSGSALEPDEDLLLPDETEWRVLGDIDYDETVTILDATLIQRELAEMVSLSDYAKLCADSDLDQIITIIDVTLIQKHIADIPFENDQVGRLPIKPVFTQVTFNSNYGSDVPPQTIICDKYASIPAAPKRDGYDFIGWYSDPDLTIAYNFGAPVAHAVTLYAKWSAIDFLLHAEKESVLLNGDDSIVVLYLETSLSADTITLCYGLENEMTDTVQMLDSGSYADDMAGDGIYSAEVNLNADVDTDFHFVAAYGDRTSNEVVINGYTPIAEDTFQALDTVEQNMESIKSSDEYVSMDQDERIDVISEALNEMVNQELIIEGSIDVNKEAGLISFQYPEGILGGVMIGEHDPEVYDFDASPAKTPVSERKEPDLAAVGDNTEPDDTGTAGTAVILNSAVSFETTVDGINRMTEPFDSCKEEWDAAGLETTITINPTVEDYKHIDNYNVICITTHGTIYSWRDGFLWLNYHECPAICLAEKSTDARNKKYELEIKSKQIACVGDHYVILPSFFEEQYAVGSFSDSFVFVECCQSLGKGKGDNSGQYDYSMANAFTGRSAKAYIGFHNSVFCDYANGLMKEYVNNLIRGNTSRQSFNNAVNVMGANHRIWYENNAADTLRHHIESKEPPETYDPLYHIAYPVHRGNDDALLVHTGLRNGGFENYNVITSFPKSWKFAGDVRTITHLGTILPETSVISRMAIISSGIGSKSTATLDDGTEGSKMYQTFIVPSGASTLSFRYNFVSEEPMEYVGSVYNDAFVVQLIQDNQPFYNHMYESINTSVWNEAAGIDFAGGDETVFQTGWKTAEIDISAYRNEIITLSFIIYDVGDTAYDSAALIDNVTII